MIKWIQNFGYSEDGYYRIEKWGGASVGFYYGLSTPEENYMKVGGPFCSAERRNREIDSAIRKHDSTAYNGA